MKVNGKSVSYWAGTFLAGPPVDLHSVRNWAGTPNSVTNWAGTKKPTKINQTNMTHFHISRGRDLLSANFYLLSVKNEKNQPKFSL